MSLSTQLSQQVSLTKQDNNNLLIDVSSIAFNFGFNKGQGAGD